MKVQSKIFTAPNINKLKRSLRRIAKFFSVENFDPNIVYSYIYYTDQQHIGKYIARKSRINDIKLDYNTTLFWCCALEWGDIQKHYQVKNNRIINAHTNHAPLIVHVPGWRAHQKVFNNLFQLQKSMKKPNLDLILSTPDGVPEDLLHIFDEILFRNNNGSETTIRDQLSIKANAINKSILDDHEKSWYQLCHFERDIPNKTEYKQEIKNLLNAAPLDSSSTIVDPLLSFFASYWMDEAADPISVFYYSEPMECAISLQTRWRFPVHFGLALWEYYIVSALAQISGKNHMLFSMTKFRESPESYLVEKQKEFYNLKGTQYHATNNVDSLLGQKWNSVTPVDELGISLQESQAKLFTMLESNSSDQLVGLTLSDSSKDILFHYGNLRSGYERLQSNKAKTKTNTGNLAMQNHEENPSVSGNAFESQNAVNDSLAEIVVHIDGMQPQTFYSEIGHPIIETLTSTLHNQSKNPNEIVFLQCGELGDSGLYFSAGDLLGIETSIVNA